MADQVKEIKSKADIVALIAERVKLKKAGRNFQGLCPFHSEKTPSFNVSPELQIYKCFGCGESGDCFEFLEKFEGMDFPEALKYMADKVGVKLAAFRPGKNYEIKEKLKEILSLTAEFYHYILKEHKVGEVSREYLKKRGVWKTTIDKFQLGYAPDSFEALIKYLVKKKKYSFEELLSAGLVVKGERGGYYDRFRGRLMFPLTNHRSQVLGFSGRVLDSEIKQAKYINSPETELYHKSELLFGLAVSKSEVKRKDKIIVMEGELDVLSSWQVGVKNVAAIKGSALTEGQLRLISRFTNNVLLALDADAAGDEAAKRGIALADKMGINVRVVTLTGGKDPDEIARDSKDKWQALVKNSVSIYDFYLASAIKKWGADSGTGKRNISQDLAPIWAKISNQVEKAHYTAKLAKALRVSELVVAREIERVGEGLEVDVTREKVA